MLHGVPTSKAIQQLRREGFKLLYRGVLPPLCQKTISASIMFGTYDFYKDRLAMTFPSIPSRMTKTVGAALAGTSEAILAPFERLQSLLQVINIMHDDF